MKLISHRGNIFGPLQQFENDPGYITDATNQGFDVEIDIWFNGDDQKLYLGHDNPEYQIEYSWLDKNKSNLWIHCKNLLALSYLCDSDFHYFWHQDDDFTLTSKQKIWTYPNKSVLERSVIVCQTLESTKRMLKENIFGVCSDYIGCIL
jgi:hypothetical protein